jgi:hypothetical protein
VKRITLAIALVLTSLAATPLFAVVSRTVLVVEDVIKMTKAGVGDDEIIEFVKKTREPFEISGDDVIAMNDARVSPAVMKLVIDESAARMKNERREGTRRETVYVTRPYYDPFYNGYYDPFWYGRGYVGFGFGFGPRFGHGFRGRHFRHH